MVWYGIWLCDMESFALRCVVLRCVTVLDRRRPGVVRGEVHTEGSVAGGRWSVVGVGVVGGVLGFYSNSSLDISIDIHS